MGDFPSQVQVQPAIGVEGDFCDHNPRSSVDAGPGGLVAGPSGATIGRFAWATYPADGDGAPAFVNNFGGGPVTGFVHRAQQALLTAYLQAYGMLIPAGFQMALMSSGGFFAKNAGATQCQVGYKAFANILNGSVSFAPAGTIPGGASGATSAVVKTTLTVVGSISGNVLTVESVGAGAVYNGAILASNGVGRVVKQLSGTPKGAGTYLLSVNEQNVAAGTTIGGFYGVITFGTVTGGPFTVNMALSGTGVAANSYISDDITGGTTSGTMVVVPETAVSSATIVGSSVVETKWIAMSVGLTGEIVKISSQPLG
jgi:hypothetical protein